MGEKNIDDYFGLNILDLESCKYDSISKTDN